MKLTLCWTMQKAMKTNGKVEVRLLFHGVLNRGIRRTRVVSFVLWPPYSWENYHRYSLERRLHALHSQNERWKRKKKISFSYLKWTADSSFVQPSAELSYKLTINQLFTSAQHLLLLIIGLHVSTDHSVIFRSLICCKFQGAVHTFGIPIVFTLKLNLFISVGG